MALAYRRLYFFAAASVACHGLMLGTPASEGHVAGYPASANEIVLNAVLAPLKAVPAASAGGLMVAVTNAVETVSERHEDTRDEPHSGEVAEMTAGLPYRDEGDNGLGFLLADKWYSVTEVDTRAEPLNPARLNYPEALAGSRIRGHVQLALFIDEQGLVRKAQILESRPQRVFDDAAIRAWEVVRFAPALKYGHPVKSEKVLEIQFIPD